MARSRFVRGADFLASMVFMLNLVIELGIVLLELMGWQFLAGEFIGGVIMIVTLVTVGGCGCGVGRSLRQEHTRRRHLAADMSTAGRRRIGRHAPTDPRRRHLLLLHRLCRGFRPTANHVRFLTSEALRVDLSLLGEGRA